MRLDVSTSRRGPIFDGRARRAANEYVNRLERQLAEEGRTILLGELDRVLKTQTPFYTTRIKVEDGHTITDSRVVYGPWLAGVGSRNYPVTKFKGYDHWIVTRDRLNSRKRGIGERLLRRYTGRM
ncbi:hypothetical protein [Streptomyces silaceus]|uniref:hypothetical protein n=1 Tax=Streptomyces silaceus TaxID=545123 RepID=UPI0006EB8E7D|nr:hypothetical protein [Streptomyces silaceus]